MVPFYQHIECLGRDCINDVADVTVEIVSNLICLCGKLFVVCKVCKIFIAARLVSER